MDISEVLTEIESRVKPYNCIEPRMAQSTFSNTVRAIKNGLCKPATKKEFLEKFGYTPIETVEQWEKK